jgi:hypothetical protein
MGVVPHATDAPSRELHQTSQGKSKKHATGSHRAGGGMGTAKGRQVVGRTRDKKGILAREAEEEAGAPRLIAKAWADTSSKGRRGLRD